MQSLSTARERAGDALSRTHERGVCLHCGTGLSPESPGDFCCTGCESVHGLLVAGGLERYYALRDGGVPAAPNTSARRDLKWLEPLEARIASATSPVRLELDVQGLHCAACVWLQSELFRREDGGMRITVSPSLGRADLLVTNTFDLRRFVGEVERFGYMFGPSITNEAPASRALITRIGICAALATNAMIFSLPLYLGLESGPTYKLFRAIAFVITSLSVIVGGSVFIKSAWHAAKRRILHLDLPIAIGMLLAFGGSTWAFLSGRDGSAYFDTVSVFITLMLVGRWLQERVLESNRRYLLASDGVDSLLARRVREGRVELVPCSEVALGDTLLIAPGDVVPVDGTLEGQEGSEASCSLDWISGESVPHAFSRGDVVPAGAFNVGRAAIELRTTTGFSSSPLVALLRSPNTNDDAARATKWWQRFVGIYVVSVLGLAAAGFVGWLVATGDAARAMEIATAVLVVTCPCAFGIATPMAYELVQAGLRRAGLFVRSSSFLDRALAVRHVVFDKTGTLTSGELTLSNASALDALDAADLEALYNLAVRSTHPKSAAIRRAIDERGARYLTDLVVVEEAGRGLSLSMRGADFRLGSAAWINPSVENADLLFAKNGAVIAVFRTDETLRLDAKAEIAELGREGYAVSILSGDESGRVASLARSVDVPASRAHGGMSPEDKARWIRLHDRHDTLMIGDGINDSLAVASAFASGTPAIDRPFMPARTDFYVVTAGLRPIGLALRAARALDRTNKRNLALATIYNVATVGLALSGHMSPLLCAVLMPLSSLSILFATIASLSRRSPVWKYSFSKSS
jgi:Cu2+-exporting ATPase